MNIKHFNYVLTIAKYQNISKAASALYISQPALTKALNNLEATLGVKLFDRTSTPIKLTYAGEVFLEEAKKILEINKHLEREMHAIANSERSKLILGIHGERGSNWLPRLIPPFTEQYPGVELQVVEGHSSTLEEKMLAGQIDICISTLPVYAPEIDFEIIADDPVIIATAKDAPFSRMFDLEDNTPQTPYLIPGNLLNQQSFLFVIPGSGMRRIAEYLFERHGIKYNISRELYRHETAVKLSAVGQGFVVTPCITPIRLGIIQQMAYFSLDNPVLTRKIIVAYNKNTVLSSTARNFINLTKQIIDSTPQLSVKNVSVLPARYK